MATASSPGMNMESMLNCSLDDIVKMQKGNINRGTRGRMRVHRGLASSSRGRVFKQIFKPQVNRGLSRSRGRGRLISSRSILNQRYNQPLPDRTNRRGRGASSTPNRRIMRSRGSLIIQRRGMRKTSTSGRGFLQRGMRASIQRGRYGRVSTTILARRGNQIRARAHISRGRRPTIPRNIAPTRLGQSAAAVKKMKPNISLNRALARNTPYVSNASKITRQIGNRAMRVPRQQFSRKGIARKGTVKTIQPKQNNGKRINPSQKLSPSDADLMSKIKIMAQLDRIPPPIAAQKGVSVAVPKAMRDQTGRYIAENSGATGVSSLNDRFSKF